VYYYIKVVSWPKGFGGNIKVLTAEVLFVKSLEKLVAGID
jgi:hypothetical protein